MPNATLWHIATLTPDHVEGIPLELHIVDEYVRTDLGYLELLRRDKESITLVALVGTQSHQFPRAMDVAAYAMKRGCLAVIGGPHPITCDTSELYRSNGQFSFAHAEAESIWLAILRDAARGGLAPYYGAEARWIEDLPSTVIRPPSKADLKRCVVPFMGYYGMRGCAEGCDFCAIPEIAGKRERSQEIDDILKSLKLAKAAGVRRIMFTSDNFNQWSKAKELMRAMAQERIRLPFFIQCTTLLYRDEEFFELAHKAECSNIFFGIESIDKKILREEHKHQNDPAKYGQLSSLCRKYGIWSHFSNIIGFPRQTRKDVLEHLDAIRGWAPDMTSWYILTPIPGTRDYAKAKKAGGLNPDLSLYDGNRSVWKHPNLSAQELEDLLFHCYRKFYSVATTIYNCISRPTRHFVGDLLLRLGNTAFTHYCAHRRAAPMSGGIGKVELDREDDYRQLRKETFGCELFPLPENRELSAQDSAMNRLVNPAVLAARKQARVVSMPAH